MSISCRFLSKNDSDSCLVLRKKCFTSSILEERPAGFFSPYLLICKEYYSIGSFLDGHLIGMCSFLNIGHSVFYITDLAVEPSMASSMIPGKIFEFAYQNLFKSDPTIKLMCLEDTLKKFDALVFYEKKYGLTKTVDEFIYQTILPIEDSIKLPAQISGPQERCEYSFFSDSNVRYFTYCDKIIKRAYVKSSAPLSKIDFEMIYKQAGHIKKSMDVNTICFLSLENMNFPQQVLYVNRLIGWNVDIDLSKFISAGYLL